MSRTVNRAACLATAALLCMAVGRACEYGYLIWSIRSRTADPLFRFVRNGKAGYIDSSGKIVVEPSLPAGDTMFGEFHEGLVAVKQDQGYRYLDRSGTVAFRADAWLAFDFSEGLAPAAQYNHGSSSFGVQISPAAPALFSADNTGRATGLILNADGTFNSPTNPAPAGSIVTLLTTGLGMTSPDAVSVMIGGQPAKAGPPTSVSQDPQASLFSVQATLPASTPAGPASVFILVGGVPSQGGLLVNVR